MTFLLQKFFIDSLNYFLKMVSFAHQVTGFEEKNVDIPDNSQSYWK